MATKKHLYNGGIEGHFLYCILKTKQISIQTNSLLVTYPDMKDM